MSNRDKELERAYFMRHAKKFILTKEAKDVTCTYAKYVNERPEGLPGEPVSEATYRRWIVRFIPKKDFILCREGKTAWRRYNKAKSGKMVLDQFMGRAEIDTLHAPLNLLNAATLKPHKTRPKIYLAVDCWTGSIVGVAIDFEGSGESPEFVIECLKSMVLPKRHWKDKYGTKCHFVQYGLFFLIVHDPGTAYAAKSTQDYIELLSVGGAMTKTQSGAQKPYVENTNADVKSECIRILPGSFCDRTDRPFTSDNRAVLTDMEFEVILIRYIVDQFNQKRPARFANGNTSTEQWEDEAKYFTPPLPKRISDAALYLPNVKDRKIDPQYGIRITRGRKFRDYNSDELQDLRVRLEKESSGKNGEVSVHSSSSATDFIRVYDRLKKTSFEVSELTDGQSQWAPRAGDIQELRPFIEEQTFEKLAELSTEEIVERALVRRRFIDRSKIDASKAKKTRAEHMEVQGMRDDELVRKARRAESAAHTSDVDDTYESEVSSDGAWDHDGSAFQRSGGAA